MTKNTHNIAAKSHEETKQGMEDEQKGAEQTKQGMEDEQKGMEEEGKKD